MSNNDHYRIHYRAQKGPVVFSTFGEYLMLFHVVNVFILFI